MERIHFSQIDETLYEKQLHNGLHVYVLPKKGFNKTYAVFTTKYGSIDNHFTPLGKSESLKVPDGIAHFLEHKMFEDEDGDVFHDFSKQGASANAFTSFTRTAYLFSSTTNVEKNLETLINFVQHPYFTDESVDKEKGIINQEIAMYNDDPDWRAYFGLINNMYENHPVKIDIAGTEQSIAQITKELLYECYHTFYHPNNMVLFVVGPVDPDEIVQQVQANQASKQFERPIPIERFFEEEKEEVVTKKQVISMPIQMPKCLVGFKETGTNRQGKALLQRELSIMILLDIMFGRGSNAYETLFNEGLIDESFSFDYSAEEGFGFSVIGGNTKEPDVLAEKIQEVITEYKDDTLNKYEVERAIKKRIGAFLRSLNSPEFIANQFTRFTFNKMNLFDVVPVLEKITVDELQYVLQDHFMFERFTICQVMEK